MANNYTITDMTYPTNAVGDPLVTITGTVNSVDVSVSVWYSVLQPKLASAVSFEAFVGPLMLQAYAALTPGVLAPPVASFNQ